MMEYFIAYAPFASAVIKKIPAQLPQQRTGMLFLQYRSRAMPRQLHLELDVELQHRTVLQHVIIARQGGSSRADVIYLFNAVTQDQFSVS